MAAEAAFSLAAAASSQLAVGTLTAGDDSSASPTPSFLRAVLKTSAGLTSFPKVRAGRVLLRLIGVTIQPSGDLLARGNLIPVVQDQPLCERRRFAAEHVALVEDFARRAALCSCAIRPRTTFINEGVISCSGLIAPSRAAWRIFIQASRRPSLRRQDLGYWNQAHRMRG